MSKAPETAPYISSRLADNLFIIGSPLIALAMIALVCQTRMKSGVFLYDPQTPQWLIIFAGVLTHAHVMMVYFRSHANPEIFRRFRLRFTVIPMLILGSLWYSPVFFGIMAFVALYWDEWHSLMQTFGFGRIYDARLGNDPVVGRKLDMGLCFVLGLLPHVVLITAIPEEVRTEGLQAYLDLPQETAIRYGYIISALKVPLICFGVAYVLYYYLVFNRLVQKGYRYSRNKLILFATTGFSAIVISSFYSVADAAYFGNIYHALQYFFIVTLSEGPRFSRKLRFDEKKTASLLVVGMVMLTVATAMAMARHFTGSIGLLSAFWLLTSLMHFWYDGFIWSVRKNDF